MCLQISDALIPPTVHARILTNGLCTNNQAKASAREAAGTPNGELQNTARQLLDPLLAGKS